MKIGLSVIAALGALILPRAGALAAESRGTFDDPARYCAAVGTIERPGQRYVGEPVPPLDREGAKEAAGGPASASLSEFKCAAWHARVAEERNDHSH